MKRQWGLVCGLLLAILIVLFAIINVESVKVNYFFGTAEWPLILIILCSVFLGALLTSVFSIIKVYRLKSEVKRLRDIAFKNVEIAATSAENEGQENTSHTRRSFRRRYRK